MKLREVGVRYGDFLLFSAFSLQTDPDESKFARLNTSVLTENLDATGQTRVRCTRPSRIPSFTLMLGTGAAGSYTPRRIFKGAESLTYNLYLDGSYGTVWGNGTAGTSFVTNNNPASRQDYVVYARTPLGQEVSAGAYSDVVTVTVDW